MWKADGPLSVSAAAPATFYFAHQEDDRDHEPHRDCKALNHIEIREHIGLDCELVQDVSLGHAAALGDRIRHSAFVVKVIAEHGGAILQCRSGAGEVVNQSALVKLRASRKNGDEECGADASPDVSRQIRQSADVIAFVLGHSGKGNGAYRNEEEGEA